MTRHRPLHVREKHADTIDALYALIAALRITLRANEPIGRVQRDGAIATLSIAFIDLKHCGTLWRHILITVSGQIGVQADQMARSIGIDLVTGQKLLSGGAK